MQYTRVLLLTLLLGAIAVASGLAQVPADSTDAHLLRAQSAINRKDWFGAEKILARLLEYNPDSFRGNFQMGVVLAATGRNERALTHLEKAYQKDSTNAELLNNLGSVNSNLGRREHALTYFKRAINTDSTNYLYFANYGQELLRISSPRAALKHLRIADSLDPNRTIVEYTMANSFAALEMLDSAEWYYRRLAGAGGGTAEMYYRMGRVQQDLQKFDAARESFDMSIRLDSAYRDAWQSLGFLQFMSEDFKNAAEAFRHVVELDSTFYRGWVSLGVCLDLTSCFSEAEQVLHRLFAVDSSYGFQMLAIINQQRERMAEDSASIKK